MSGLRVLHYTTWKTKCGIGTYAEQLVRALEQIGVQGSVHPIDVAAIRHMSRSEMRSRLAALCEEAKQYDVLHIQHEYSFFGNGPFVLRRANENFSYLLRLLAAARVPTVVSFHTQLQGTSSWDVGRRRWLGRFLGESLRCKTSLYLQQWRVPRALRASPERFRAITFSPRPQSTYINGGLHPDVVRMIPMAVPRPCRDLSQINSKEAKERLGLPRDCILLSQFGFILAHKGYEFVVRALELLPENYYLAVVGGPYPDAPGDQTLNRILEIWQGRNPERLRVTGFVSDEERDLYHAASDICLCPYTWSELSASGAVTWALTSGKPLIASTIPHFREINDVYNCMLTVAPGMVHELAWQIRRLAASTELQQRLTRNAVRYAEDRSLEVTARRYAAEFEEMASRQSHASVPSQRASPRSKAA